jgi:hypothetical protein
MVGEYEAGAGGAGENYEHALADALGRLETGTEPRMPDLVPSAVALGTRLRRRRHLRRALGAVAAMAVLAVGGYSLAAPASTRDPVPAASTPSAWYPSLEQLRWVLPPSMGTVGPQEPGRYFPLTDKAGRVSDLYVSITRSTIGPAAASKSRPVCGTAAGQVGTTPWGGRPTECAGMETHSGEWGLAYDVAEKSLPAPRSAGDDSFATGFSRVIPGGWMVWVIESPRDKSLAAPGIKGRDVSGLSGLAGDSRLLAAFSKSGH